MIYLSYLKPNSKTHTYETANYFGTGEYKVNLMISIIVMKSYSYRISEIATGLSKKIGT